MPQAKNLLALLEIIRTKFNKAKEDEHKIKPDLVTLCDAIIAEKSLAEVKQLLDEFGSMTVNYDILHHDRTALGELLGGMRYSGPEYHRKRLSFVVKAILYGQYGTIQVVDQARLDAAQRLAEQEELAS